MSTRTTTRYERLTPVGGSLADMTIEDLAGWAFGLNNPTPGMNYARKMDFSEKDKARLAVLGLFTKDEWFKGLSIVTMPGISWSFERMLLLMRERRKRALGDQGKRPERTYIAGIERDEAIYRASLNWIPGGKHSLAQLPAKPDSPLSVRTYAIARYHRISFENFVDAPWLGIHDAAWLDFNGPITSQRLEKIMRFWKHNIRWRLVLTWMNARYDTEAIKQIGEVGGRFDAPVGREGGSAKPSRNCDKSSNDAMGWVESSLNAHSTIRVLHRLSYRDTSPMLQLAVEKI